MTDRVARTGDGDQRSSRGPSRRAALGGLGALAAPMAVGGCLGLGSGGRDAIVLTGVQIFNWTGEAIDVDLTLSIDGSDAFETTVTVPDSNTAAVSREWSDGAGSYRLQASANDGSLSVDADLPDGGWSRGRCAWADINFGSQRRGREVGGATDEIDTGVELRENDEGPFQDECPAE
ncbi:hypothetical protein [Halosimplex sp. J119]